MYSAWMALAIVVWFGLLVGLLRPRTLAPLAEAHWMPPALILAGFFFMPYAFLVQRADGTDLLEEGLSSSNVITLGFACLAALWCAWVVAGTPRLVSLLLDRVLFPFWLFMAVACASVAWSIVPSYTIYRALELVVLFSLCVLVLDRRRFEHGFLAAHVVLLLAWLAVRSTQIVDGAARGIFFSSAKDNLMPLLCLSVLLMLAVGERPRRGALLIAGLAATCFVLAGSAATVGAIPLIFTGLLAASPDPVRRLVGYVASAVWMVVFAVLLAGLASFPELMEAVSVALQKPVVELEQATGRGKLWPIFIEATLDRNVGAGFAAGERFIQLLVDEAAVQERLGTTRVFFSSSHNMLISSWVGTGWIGLLTLATCLGLAWREGTRLDAAGRRYVLPILLVLSANGLTTPGIFGEFNLHTVTWVTILCCIRAHRTAPRPTRVPALAAARRRPPRLAAATSQSRSVSELA